MIHIGNYKSLLVITFFLIMFFLFTSCDEVQDMNVGVTRTEALSGDWWVIQLQSDGVTPVRGEDYALFSTYNTSSNADSIWLDNHGRKKLKVKVKADINALTFSSSADASNIADKGTTVTITDGKITKNSYTVASGTKVNEITFNAVFSATPSETYVFKGHKRTGFAEDVSPHYSSSK